VSERVAFLGPQGTFSEEACIQRFGEAAQLVPCASIRDVVESLVDGRADIAVVPVENTRIGTIADTARALQRRGKVLAMTGQVRLPVRHLLVAAPGTVIAGIGVVTSHPQALAQCRLFLEKSLTAATREPAASTAAAVERALAEPGTAAIASRRAAAIYGAAVLASDIQDPGDSITTFAVVARA
jgi:chorismate mutase/prephenate dehydratase